MPFFFAFSSFSNRQRKPKGKNEFFPFPLPGDKNTNKNKLKSHKHTYRTTHNKTQKQVPLGILTTLFVPIRDPPAKQAHAPYRENRMNRMHPLIFRFVRNLPLSTSREQTKDGEGKVATAKRQNRHPHLVARRRTSDVRYSFPFLRPVGLPPRKFDS